MLAEFLEQEASQVKTAAAQFREIISTIDKVAAESAGQYFARSDFESPLNCREESVPGGVTKALTAPDLPRVSAATNNPSVEQGTPVPPKDGNSVRMSAKGDKSPFQPDPLKTDPAGDSVLKTGAKDPGGIIDRLRRGYHLGRAQHALKGVEKGDTVVKIRNKAGKVIDTIKPGDKPGKMSEWLSQATGSGWAGETGRHLGKHQEKYVTGGLVAGGTGAIAALTEREARKNREKTAGLKDRVATRLSKIRRAYRAGQAEKGMKSIERSLSDARPRNQEREAAKRVRKAISGTGGRTWDTTSTEGTGVLEDAAHHLGKHRTKYLAGGAAAIPTAALVAREATQRGKTKKSSFEGAVEKMAAAGKVRTLEGWNKNAALKLPSAVMDAAKKARKVGKPAPLKQPKMNIISGFSTGRR